MRRLYRPGIAALLTMVCLTGAPVHAETVVFKAELKAPNEMPPNDSNGTASVAATYDTSSKLLSWKGTYSGMTTVVTMAHFHGPAQPGRSAGVALWISTKGKPLPASFEGQATLTDAQAADLLAGLWYVNLHTVTRPGGEIRGHLERVK